MELPGSSRPRLRLKAWTLAAAVSAVSLLHFTVGIETHELHVVHVLLRSLYLILIIAAALWFELAGALVTALIISGVYGLHIATTWAGHPMENVNQLAMMAVYLIVAVVAGALSSLETRERTARLAAERRAQREVILNSMDTLSQALKWRDEYTRRHSENVATLSVEIAQRLGMAPDRIELVRLAARVHDIGKIGVRDDILLKADRLTPEERAVIDRHPTVAADILRPIAGSEEIAEIVLAHHECPDGSGYPRGLKRDEIPDEALVLSVADMFSALTEDRPYKAGMEAERALRVIEEMCGSKLDGRAVEALRGILRSQTRRESREQIESSSPHTLERSVP